LVWGARFVAPELGHAQRSPTLQGAQKLRGEAHGSVRRNDSPCWISNRFFSRKKPKRLAGSLKREAFIQTGQG
jgi:hypothetical protein